MRNRHQLKSLKFKVLNQFFSLSKSPSQGFTLTELLLAALISIFVIGAAGFGLVKILQTNNKAEELNLRKLSLNRALDFIALETQQAKEIVDPSTITFSPPSGAGDVQKVLALRIPDDSNGSSNSGGEVTREIVYFLASPPSSSVWSGERVLYRRGPNLKLDPDLTVEGIYSDSSPQNKVLIDFISDQTPNENDNCPSGWDSYPAKADRKGFYACVKDDAIALVYLEGEKDQANDYVSVQSNIFARSN